VTLPVQHLPLPYVLCSPTERARFSKSPSDLSTTRSADSSEYCHCLSAVLGVCSSSASSYPLLECPGYSFASSKWSWALVLAMASASGSKGQRSMYKLHWTYLSQYNFANSDPIAALSCQGAWRSDCLGGCCCDDRCGKSTPSYLRVLIFFSMQEHKTPAFRRSYS